jgi:hypothetical protein
MAAWIKNNFKIFKRRKIIMKKIRIASLLLVLVLATSCFVGTTFAKYTTGDNATDIARVAKWGVTVQAQDAEIFGQQYIDVIVDADGTVLSQTDLSEVDDLVAPGTNGDFGSIAIAGKPEVKVNVTTVVDLELSEWDVAIPDDLTGVYFPIVITVDGTALQHKAAENETIEAFELRVENAILSAIYGGTVTGTTDGTGVKYNKEYEAGSDLGTDINDIEITWAWAFETDVNGYTAQTDARDTALGNNFNDTIEFTYAVTVDQVD